MSAAILFFFIRYSAVQIKLPTVGNISIEKACKYIHSSENVNKYKLVLMFGTRKDKEFFFFLNCCK